MFALKKGLVMRNQNEPRKASLVTAPRQDLSSISHSNALIARGLKDFAEIQQCIVDSKATVSETWRQKAYQFAFEIGRILGKQGSQKRVLTYSQILDYLPNDAMNPEMLDGLLVHLKDQGVELIYDSPFKERVDRVFKTLKYREREIIKLRYGLGDGYLYTADEVCRIFKTMTPGEVRQIEDKALRMLSGQ